MLRRRFYFYLAVELAENLCLAKTTQQVKSPWLIVFIFGLIHGMGYANALLNLSLPKNQFWTALIGFNIGVEILQLILVGLFSTSLVLLRTHTPKLAYRVSMSSTYLAGGIASFWFIQRLVDGLGY